MKCVFYAFVRIATIKTIINLFKKDTIFLYQYKNIIIIPLTLLSEFILLNRIIIYNKPNSVKIKILNEIIFNYFKL